MHHRDSDGFSPAAAALFALLGVTVWAALMFLLWKVIS